MSTTVEAYLRGGVETPWHVPDLVPVDTSALRLLLVLESPHRDELLAHRPIVGGAGRSALGFLLGPKPARGGLGDFVAALHSVGDQRVAIMNVSNVPLQQSAFAGSRSKPELASRDWRWLEETFRKSKASSVNQTSDARANASGQLLLDGLQRRIDQCHLNGSCVVVACGNFAKRYVRQLSALPGCSFDVHHPSRSRWQREPIPGNLARLRSLFRDATGQVAAA